MSENSFTEHDHTLILPLMMHDAKVLVGSVRYVYIPRRDVVYLQYLWGMYLSQTPFLYLYLIIYLINIILL